MLIKKFFIISAVTYRNIKSLIFYIMNENFYTNVTQTKILIISLHDGWQPVRRPQFYALVKTELFKTSFNFKVIDFIKKEAT